MRISDWSSDVCSSDLRHQPGARWQHGVAELPRKLVTETSGTHARNRQPATGGNQCWRGNRSGAGVQNKLAVIGVLHARDVAIGLHLHTGGIALGEQHRHDLFRRVVAEQLPQFFFVEGNAVLLHQLDEMPWRIARQRRRSEEHTSELQSLMRFSYAVFCLNNKKKQPQLNTQTINTKIQKI